MLELLETYATSRDIYQYTKKDLIGQLYSMIKGLIIEYKTQYNKGNIHFQIDSDRKYYFAALLEKIHHFSTGKHDKSLNGLADFTCSTLSEYYLNRMALIGANESNIYTITETGKEKVFSLDPKTGNIEILVTRLNGEYIYYEDSKTDKRLPYKIKRQVKPKGDNKYLMPKGAGTYPFFPEPLKKAYRDKQEIETLFITEGAFKSWVGCKNNIFTVGLSSITHYSDSSTAGLPKNRKVIHSDIVNLLKTCKIKNVVILWDNDCTSISDSDLNFQSEITKKSRGFYNSAKALKQLIEKENIPSIQKIYFSTIKTPEFKGLDDLIIGKKDEFKTISNSANELRPNPYFKFIEITKSTKTLFDFFCLDNANTFYSRHADKIGSLEFIYNKDRYRYIETTEELVLIQPAFAESLVWVGNDVYQLQDQPQPAAGDRIVTSTVLAPIKKETCKDLFCKDFLKYLKRRHFVSFCNMPDHKNYNRVIETDSGNRYYNRYFPFEHTPEQGSCSNILSFVKHIFGNLYELGLDYIKLLYEQPTQKLPVLCLYSAENSTGKSLFCNLLAEIFKNNTVTINNNTLRSNFGASQFGDKLLVFCEETLLERKQDAETIKALSTANSPILIDVKNHSAFQMLIHCKFVFCSNNLRMIYATEQDERFLILQVPKPVKKDTELLEKMIKEIPAFLNFLENRQFYYPKKGRMYFDPELYKTEVFEKVIRINEHSDVSELRLRLESYFNELPAEYDEVMMPVKVVQQMFLPNRALNWISEILTDRLKIKRLRTSKGSLKKISGYYPQVEIINKQAQVHKVVFARNSVFIFNRAEFIKDIEEPENEHESGFDKDFIEETHKLFE